MRILSKRFLMKFIWPLHALNRLIIRKKSYLHTTGWVNSMKLGYPCSRDGSELPWMNYQTINFLKERLHKDLNIFEYGSGYSTLFYARLANSVISIEYDKKWLKLMESKVPDNVTLIYKEKDIDNKYCRAINEFNQDFDIVIVDGRDRVNCVKQSIKKLSDKGAIILDDSSRDRYRQAIDLVENSGFRTLTFEGLKPKGSDIYKTTIIYRDGNCLGI